MKSLKYFFLIVIAFAGCAGYSQKANDIVKIEFTSLTRGYNKQIIVTKDSVITVATGRGSEEQNKKVKLSSKEWERVVAAVQGITLSEVPDLKSPTEKRMYDGARHSTITISTSTGMAVSHSFDDEMPHEKLQKLMKEITKLEKSVK
jgi:hypothetical protein